MSNKHDPILMENYFSPGFKTKPAVHMGSQTLKFFSGIPEEQAWEGVMLAGSSDDDVAVVRNISSEYLQYWKALMNNSGILNITDSDPGKFLTQVLLESKKYKEWITAHMSEQAKLMVFFPTALEEQLADELTIPLHGLPRISEQYGTKSGIRELAQSNNILMAPGFICTTYKEAEDAFNSLKETFEYIVIKHDLSVSGYYSKKLATRDITEIRDHIENLTGQSFVEGKDILVIEGWLKSKASLCAHIEIVAGQKPVACAGWQQIIDDDGITYLGGGPLMLSQKALDSFIVSVNELANALYKQGAIGSFGPDFLITADDETILDPDSCVLIELNARVPYTAFPLEIVKKIKGKIGSGFYAKHIKVKKPTEFKDIEEVLKREKLFITSKDTNAKGVVPYNTGLLPWNIFDMVAMADSWEETLSLVDKVNKIFS